MVQKDNKKKHISKINWLEICLFSLSPSLSKNWGKEKERERKRNKRPVAKLNNLRLD